MLMADKAYGAWHVAAFWHITKVPLPALQFGVLTPGLRVHLPTTTPSLRVPVEVGVALDVPVSSPVRARMLPSTFEVTVRFNVPETLPALVVVNLASPVAEFDFRSVEKHAP